RRTPDCVLRVPPWPRVRDDFLRRGGDSGALGLPEVRGRGPTRRERATGREGAQAGTHALGHAARASLHRGPSGPARRAPRVAALRPAAWCRSACGAAQPAEERLTAV